jgi:hypothetical protein
MPDCRYLPHHLNESNREILRDLLALQQPVQSLAKAILLLKKLTLIAALSANFVVRSSSLHPRGGMSGGPDDGARPKEVFYIV